MLSQNEIKNILDKVMDISTADETEAYVGSHRNALTRLAENRIHQNVSEDDAHLSVTAILGKRMGDASTNKLDDESIKKTVANAIEIAKLAPPVAGASNVPSIGATFPIVLLISDHFICYPLFW